MKLIKVAAGVVNQTPMAWESNLANIKKAIVEAQNQDVSILCLPELCITGYGCEDAFYALDTYTKSIEMLQEIASICSGIIVSVGLPIRFNNKIYNAACLISNTKILGFACKQHLPNYGLFYEDRWFHRWQECIQAEIEIDEFRYFI